MRDGVGAAAGHYSLEGSRRCRFRIANMAGQEIEMISPIIDVAWPIEHLGGPIVFGGRPKWCPGAVHLAQARSGAHSIMVGRSFGFDMTTRSAVGLRPWSERNYYYYYYYAPRRNTNKWLGEKKSGQVARPARLGAMQAACFELRKFVAIKRLIQAASVEMSICRLTVLEPADRPLNRWPAQPQLWLIRSRLAGRPESWAEFASL